MVLAQNNSLQPTVPDRVTGFDERGIEECFPLSYAQETLWLAEQMSPGTPTYNLPEAWVLQGQVNPTALQEAMDELVCRHETLRTLFRSREGRPEQVVLAAAHLEINRVDLGSITDPEGELQRRLAIEARVPFDLARAPLARATLFRTGEERHVLYLNVHHLISDAWSQSILIRELVDRYSAKILQQSCAVPPLPVQFADFSLWQRDLLKSDLGQTHLAYWKNIMRTAPDAPALFPGHATSDSFVYRGSTHFLKISGALKSALREVGRRDGATLFMTLLASFEALLHRYTLEEQIVVGVPMACRERMELENVIGFFVHTQPLCPNLSGDPTFLELLRRIREGVLQASEHQEVPCELALQAVAAARPAAARPLFQFVFGWQGAAVESWTAPGLSASKIELETGTAKFPWTILVSESPGGLLLRSEFSTDFFEPATMTRLLRQFQTLLEGIAVDPSRKISELELENRSETEVLARDGGQTDSDYERESRIHELFEAQAAHTPNSVAVEFGGEFISYADLNGRANQVANHLRDCGVEPGTSVGLCLNRSVELIVGMLAILKAGAAYVPLDPESPPDRLKLLLEDCSVCHVVTNRDCALGLAALAQEERLVLIDEQQARLAVTDQQNPKMSGSSTDLAYVMYTSGSTGVPKGTLIPHRAVLRLVRNTNYLEFSSDLVFLQYAPVCFDASTFEIWGALLNGARLVVAPPGILSLEQLGRTIRECRISTLWLTAGLFNQMVDHRLEDLRGLKHLLTGGEALSPSHVSRALRGLPGSQLINGYGPTENTTFTCCYCLPRSWPATRPVPIGHPVSNSRVHVLDQNMKPVPIGVPGELYAGGDGLALGYLKRPELTAERFVSNPFETGSVLYRTGDLVRWAADGTLEFLRRMDNQVKIRGHRIEPGEVENVLAQLAWVESSAVVAQDHGGTKQLVAYVVARANSNSSKDQLRGFLASKVPGYAVPAHIFLVDELPLTTNGKIDRRALEQRPLRQAQPQPLHRSAKNTTEAQLVEIWQEVLGREQIGVEQNFFELGGHSLMATQMISRICRVFKRELAVGSIFDAPTIAELAAVVESTGPMHSCPGPAAMPSIGAVQAAQLLDRLDEFSEAELDQLLQSTGLQSTL